MSQNTKACLSHLADAIKAASWVRDQSIQAQDHDRDILEDCIEQMQAVLDNLIQEKI